MPKHGVELFFAISGFILGVPFASRYLLHTPKVDLKSYFLRRLTRLEPPYFLALFAWAAMQRLVAHRSVTDMAPHLLAHSLYVQNLTFGAFVGAVNTVAWSLEVGIQFYILVPLLSFMFAIGDARLRRTLILLAMLRVLGRLERESGDSTMLTLLDDGSSSICAFAGINWFVSVYCGFPLNVTILSR